MNERYTTETSEFYIWFLIVFFFNILGGIVAYFKIRKVNENSASYFLTFGILTTFAWATVIYTILY